MANKVTIDVEARFVDNVSGKTKKASKAVDDIGKSADQTQKKLNNMSKNKSSVDVDDSKFTKKLNTIEKKLGKLAKSNTKVAFLLNATDKATNVINKVYKAGNKLAGKTFRGIVSIKDSSALSTINKIIDGGRNISGKTWNAIVKVKDYALAPLTKIKNMLFSIKSLVLAITAGMAAKTFIASPIALADAYSGANIGFSTLLGESRGQQLMDELDVFAKETPFKASQVIAQTQRMLAMGWDVENIIEDMETIGDAAAATGKGEQGLEQIVLALSQIKTKGRLSTEELNQLAEAGLSAKRYLAEGLGYGTGDEGIAKMTKDLENGAIASGVALEALLSGMKEYQGMMDATANETVGGLWSQIEDTFEINIFRRWGQGLQDGAKKSFGSLVSLIDTADASLGEFGDTLYNLGSTISNYAATKLGDVVEKMTEITGSYEFKNASLGEQISMLWKGIVTDPIGEWWEGGGREKTIESAGKVGKWIGETLTAGILGILGVTDIFKDSELGESGGMNVAQSFAKGFVDGFDASAISDKLIEAISNVWNALPWWGKALVGGYAAGKIGSFAGSAIGGIGNLVSLAKGAGGLIGGTGTAMVGGTGLLGKLASAGYAVTGGAAGSTLAGGTAALIGGASIAGGVAGGSSAIKGVVDLVGAYKSLKAGDTTEAKAKGASGGSALGGVAAGAAAGAAIGSVIPGLGTLAGGLIGAGIGGVSGWIAGDKWADSIRSAKYETEEMQKAIEDADISAEDLAKTFEKAIYENLQKNMGQIKLTASEITRIADQIVWGDSLNAFDQYTQATKTAASNLETLKNAAANTDKWMWKAGLGVTFNDDEMESIAESFSEYISAAQSYVENKHYEFTAAVGIILDPTSESGKGIIASGDAFYTSLQEQINSLGSELSGKISIALEDGVITLDEEAEIANLQGQMADISNKLAEAQSAAEMDLIKLKFSGGTLDLDSYESLMSQMQATIDERMNTSDDAFVASVSSLKLQLSEGAISQEEYDAQIQDIVTGYQTTIDSLRAEVQSVELDIIAGSEYGTMLGEDAKEKLNEAMSSAIKDNTNPIEWTTDEVRTLLGADSLSEESAAAIGQIMGGVYEQLQSLKVDGSIVAKWTVSNENDPAGLIKESVPSTINVPVNVNLTGRATFDSSRMNISGRFARGGIAGYSNGGIVRGGSQLIEVAEEGSPEMIIPLSSQRRNRALKLWAQAGNMMGVPGFARGGLTSGAADEGIRFSPFSSGEYEGSPSASIDVGGIHVEIQVHANNNQNIAEAIREQGAEIAETVAGILADALEEQFENTPTKGGVA